MLLPAFHLSVSSQPSAALGCRTNTAWSLSLKCRVTPRQWLFQFKTVRARSFLFAPHFYPFHFLCSFQINIPFSHFVKHNQTSNPLWLRLGSCNLQVCRSICPSNMTVRYLPVVLDIRPSSFCPTPLLLSSEPLFCLRANEIFVNPTWCVVLTHYNFDITLLPPWPVLYLLPAICLLFAFPRLHFVCLLFRFGFMVFDKDIFCWAQMCRFHPHLFLTCTK